MADDNSWVFDSLVCFLHGPIWNAPLQTFVEEKSMSNLFVYLYLEFIFYEPKNLFQFLIQIFQ